MGTYIVGGIIILALGLVIRKMIRDKKNGKTCCSGDCNNCRRGRE